MSWKSFACVAALSALIVSPALAQPSLNWVDNGGSATLQIIPSGTGSIGAEIAVTFTDVIDAAILADAVSFDTANPGANPFTGGDTTGLFTTNLASGEVFASFGSIVLASAIPIDYLTLDYSAAGSFSASSVITAEGGAIFMPTVADLAVTAGFVLGDANNDGIVNTNDVSPFVQALTDPSGYQVAFPGVVFPAQIDTNLDTLFNTNDVDSFVAILTGGSTSTATAVPEPSAAILAVFAACSLGFRKRNS